MSAPQNWGVCGYFQDAKVAKQWYREPIIRMNYLYEQTGVRTILVRGFSHQGHHPLVFLPSDALLGGWTGIAELTQNTGTARLVGESPRKFASGKLSSVVVDTYPGPRLPRNPTCTQEVSG